MEKSQHSYRAGAQHTSLQQVVMCVVICVVMCIFTCVSVPRRRQHAHFLYFVLFFFLDSEFVFDLRHGAC